MVPPVFPVFAPLEAITGLRRCAGDGSSRTLDSLTFFDVIKGIPRALGKLELSLPLRSFRHALVRTPPFVGGRLLVHGAMPMRRREYPPITTQNSTE